MYVCLCIGATSAEVSECVKRGASTSKEVAEVCEAGSVCGRCKATIRAIIEAEFAARPEGADPPPRAVSSPETATNRGDRRAR